MNASDRPNPMRWLPFALFAAALAGSPAAWGNCCGDDGGSESYGTNTDPVAGCIIKSWLTKNHKVMGEDACGCEEGHTPGSAITCCDVSLSVEWTQQCTPSDGGSRTVYTGHVYSNDTQVGTLTLAGLVVRPEGGGCTGGGCGGANGPQQGQAQAISPYLKHRVSLGPRSGALSIAAAEPDM